MKIVASGTVTLRYDGERLRSEGGATVEREDRTLRITSAGGASTISIGSGVTFGHAGSMFNVSNVVIGDGVVLGSGNVCAFGDGSVVVVNGRRVSPDRDPKLTAEPVDVRVDEIDTLQLDGHTSFHWNDEKVVRRLTVTCSGHSELNLRVPWIDELTVHTDGHATVLGTGTKADRVTVLATNHSRVRGMHAGSHTVHASGHASVELDSHGADDPVVSGHARAAVSRCRCTDAP